MCASVVHKLTAVKDVENRLDKAQGMKKKSFVTIKSYKKATMPSFEKCETCTSAITFDRMTLTRMTLRKMECHNLVTVLASFTVYIMIC